MPKNPGLPRSIPILFGWDLEAKKSYERSGGVERILRDRSILWEGPSLKLTAKAPENGWLEGDPFLLGPSAYFQVQTCC